MPNADDYDDDDLTPYAATERMATKAGATGTRGKDDNDNDSG